MENRKYRFVTVFTSFVFVLLCGSLFTNYKMATYLNEYEEQIERQDSMIRSLTFSNDLVKEFFDISEDTITHMITYTLKESKRTKEIEHVTKYENPVFVRNGKEMASDEMVNSIITSEQKSVEEIKELVDQYNALVNDYNELGRKFQSIHDSASVRDAALKLIKRNYGIDYLSNLDGDMRTVKVFGSKADSAFLLLPYYRHKLSYDPKTSAWIVEYEKKVRKK